MLHGIMRTRVARVVALVVVALLATAGVESAHEHRELVDGQYEITVGFINEPAVAEEPNGLWFSVVKLEGEGEATETPAADASIAARSPAPPAPITSTSCSCC